MHRFVIQVLIVLKIKSYWHFDFLKKKKKKFCFPICMMGFAECIEWQGSVMVNFSLWENNATLCPYIARVFGVRKRGQLSIVSARVEFAGRARLRRPILVWPIGSAYWKLTCTLCRHFNNWSVHGEYNNNECLCRKGNATFDVLIDRVRSRNEHVLELYIYSIYVYWCIRKWKEIAREKGGRTQFSA